MRTDHKPLLALNRTHGNLPVERLQAELQDYMPYTVEYMKGTLMPADGLSRSAVSTAAVQSEFAYSERQIKQLQQEDPLCKAITCFLWYKLIPRDANLRSLVRQFGNTCRHVNGILKRRTSRGKEVVVAPAGIRLRLLHDAHDNRLAGHFGTLKTKLALENSWWWPSLPRDVEAHCKGCHACALVNRAPHGRPTPMQALEPVTRPFQRVHVDLLQLPTAGDGSKYAVLMIDAFTKWVEAVALPSKEAKFVARAFATSWIARHGAPEKLVTDQGSEFTASVFRELVDSLHINHTLSTAGHPESNGLVERANQTIINYFRKYVEDCNDWPSILQFGVFSHNSSYSASTRSTPYRMLYFNDPLLPHSFLDRPRPDYCEGDELKMAALMRKAYATAAANSQAAFASQKRAHDARARDRHFQVGDRVYIRSTRDVGVGKKLAPRFRGPFFIVREVRRDVYEIRRNRGHRLQTIHAQDIKLVPFEPKLFLQDTRPLLDSCPSSSSPGHSPTPIRENRYNLRSNTTPIFVGDDPPPNRAAARHNPFAALATHPPAQAAQAAPQPAPAVRPMARPRRVYTPATPGDVAGNTRARMPLTAPTSATPPPPQEVAPRDVTLPPSPPPPAQRQAPAAPGPPLPPKQVVGRPP